MLIEKRIKMGKEYAFVDLQGFKSNLDKFVVKEIAIITRNTTFHDVIKSTPSKFSDLDIAHKKQVKWLTYNFHGLKWEWGFITLKQLRLNIEPILSGKIVYVKGENKIKWLEQILGYKWDLCKIVDIEPFDCALSLNIKKNCTTHQKFQVCKQHAAMKNKLNCHCALKNVYILEDWFQNNQSAVKSETENLQ